MDWKQDFRSRIQRGRSISGSIAVSAGSFAEIATGSAIATGRTPEPEKAGESRFQETVFQISGKLIVPRLKRENFSCFFVRILFFLPEIVEKKIKT